MLHTSRFMYKCTTTHSICSTNSTGSIIHVQLWMKDVNLQKVDKIRGLLEFSLHPAIKIFKLTTCYIVGP